MKLFYLCQMLFRLYGILEDLGYKTMTKDHKIFLKIV